MDNNIKVTLLIPTINEEIGLKKILPRIKREWVDQIIVLDGGSTDRTVEYARGQGLEVVIQKTKGLRNGYMEAYDHIRGDVLITFSPDGNSIPELIPELVERMKGGCDMVIASRYKGPAKSADDDFITSFGNWMFTKLINVIYGSDYTDSMVIFRAYKKKLIKDLDLDAEDTYLPEKFFFTIISWEPILSVRCATRKLRVEEIPGDEPPRFGGERKLQIIRWGSAYLVQILRDRFIWK